MLKHVRRIIYCSRCNRWANFILFVQFILLIDLKHVLDLLQTHTNEKKICTLMQRQEKNLDEEIQIILSSKEEEGFDIKHSNGQISLKKKEEGFDLRYSNDQGADEKQVAQRNFRNLNAANTNSLGSYSDELLTTKHQTLKLGDERISDEMSCANDFYKIQKGENRCYEMDIDSIVANSKPFLDFNNKNDGKCEKQKIESGTNAGGGKDMLSLEEVLGIGFKKNMRDMERQVQSAEGDYDDNSYRLEHNKPLEFLYSNGQKSSNELIYRNNIKYDEKLSEKWANPDFLNISRPFGDTLYERMQSERRVPDNLGSYVDEAPQVDYNDYGSKYYNSMACDRVSPSYSSDNYSSPNGIRNQRYSNSGLKSLYYNKIFQQQGPAYSPENLLFRNPMNYSDQFKSQVYYKIKKRRRLNSNTWNTSENTSIVHPSRLSSLEFLHGRPNPTGGTLSDSNYSSISFILNSNGEMTAENLKIIENFKKITENLDFNNVTVFQLKQLMKDFGLNHAGKKNDLINRIKTSLQEIASLLSSKAPSKESSECEKEIKKEDAVYDKFFF